jgi:hypothetical protein
MQPRAPKLPLVRHSEAPNQQLPDLPVADLLSRLSHALGLCLCTSYATTSSRIVRGGSRSCLADDSGGRGLDVGHGPFDDFVGSVSVEVVAQNNE